MNATERKPGVWTSLKRMGDTLLATAQNRIELFGVELQEERARLVQAVLCAMAVAAFAMMAVALVTMTVILLFWENGRLIALAILSVVYLTGTVLAWRSLQARLKSDAAFSGTLGELRKDRSCLDTES